MWLSVSITYLHMILISIFSKAVEELLKHGTNHQLAWKHSSWRKIEESIRYPSLPFPHKQRVGIFTVKFSPCATSANPHAYKCSCKRGVLWMRSINVPVKERCVLLYCFAFFVSRDSLSVSIKNCWLLAQQKSLCLFTTWKTMNDVSGGVLWHIHHSS